jgi:hypothetical protein
MEGNNEGNGLKEVDKDLSASTTKLNELVISETQETAQASCGVDAEVTNQEVGKFCLILN